VLERSGRVEVSPPNDNARLARSAACDDSVGYRPTIETWSAYLPAASPT
jgi:hypothetical protein